MGKEREIPFTAAWALAELRHERDRTHAVMWTSGASAAEIAAAEGITKAAVYARLKNIIRAWEAYPVLVELNWDYEAAEEHHSKIGFGAPRLRKYHDAKLAYNEAKKKQPDKPIPPDKIDLLYATTNTPIADIAWPCEMGQRRVKAVGWSTFSPLTTQEGWDKIDPPNAGPYSFTTGLGPASRATLKFIVRLMQRNEGGKV